MDIVLAVLLVLLAIALIVFVLFQTGGRSNKLSQSISGGSPENYTGKNKQRAQDKKYARVTTIIAIVFAILVIVFAIIINHRYNNPSTPAESTAAQTEAPSNDTEAPAATEAATEAPAQGTETVVTGAVLE